MLSSTILATRTIAKLDFGQPGVNVQQGFLKLGLPDSTYNSRPFKGTFPCHTQTCAIVIDGYDYIRGSYREVTNKYSNLSNILRSAMFKKTFGVMTVTITGVKPLTSYKIKTYHHDTWDRGGRFTLQYNKNKIVTLKESTSGQNPDPPLIHTEIITSSHDGKIVLDMKCLVPHGGAFLCDLNGMEILQPGNQFVL